MRRWPAGKGKTGRQYCRTLKEPRSEEMTHAQRHVVAHWMTNTDKVISNCHYVSAFPPLRFCRDTLHFSHLSQKSPRVCVCVCAIMSVASDLSFQTCLSVNMLTPLVQLDQEGKYNRLNRKQLNCEPRASANPTVTTNDKVRPQNTRVLGVWRHRC